MAELGSVYIRFEVEPDSEAIGKVFDELKKIADAESDSNLINTPLAWVRHGERYCATPMNHGGFAYDGYECSNACAGVNSSFDEFEQLMKKYAPTISYTVSANNYNTVIDETVFTWKQECAAIASHKSADSNLRMLLPVGHGVVYITNWDDADNEQRDAAKEIFEKYAALHDSDTYGINEWTWLAEEHDPLRPHMQKIHFGVPGVLDAVKDVYGEISRLAPQLEITGHVEECVPLGFIEEEDGVGPLDFRDSSISPNKVCDVDETRCFFWSPSGVPGLAWNQDGEFGSTEGFEKEVERFCAPVLDGLPQVFCVKGKKLKPSDFMDFGAPLSPMVKFDARNGEFFPEYEPYYLPKDSEDRYGFISFASFYQLGFESVSKDYGKPGSLFVRLVGPNGKAAGRLDAGREANRLLSLCAGELVCFAVNNDPYAVVVDRAPNTRSDVAEIGYQFKTTAKYVAKNPWGSLSEYEKAHPERDVESAVDNAVKNGIIKTKR